MKTSTVWDFLGSNLISLLTVLLAIIVIFLDQTGVLPDRVVLSSILGLLALLATSEIVENRRRISRIDENLGIIVELAKGDVKGIETRQFQTQTDALTYMIERQKNVKRSLDIATLTRQISQAAPLLSEYYKAREAVIRNQDVRVRYVSVLYNTKRLENCHKYLTDTNISNYFVGFYKVPPELPLLTFIIIDNNEIFTFKPYKAGVEEGYLSIKSPDILDLFQAYFNQVWDNSYKVTSQEDVDKLLS